MELQQGGGFFFWWYNKHAGKSRLSATHSMAPIDFSRNGKALRRDLKSEKALYSHTDLEPLTR